MNKPHYCESCGAKLASGAKFCAKCGREIGTAKDIPKKRINRGVLFLILAIVFSFFGFIALSAPNKTGDSAGSVFFVAGGFFYLAAIFELFRWIFRKNKIVAIAIIILMVILSSFSVVYIQARQAYLSQISEILENGAEIAYAKSVGDDLLAGRKVADRGFYFAQKSIFDVNAQEKITSMAQVRSKIERELGRIKTKKVGSQINQFRMSIETWSQTIFDASNFKNPEKPTREERATWQNLPQTPSVVSINLGGDRQVGALDFVAYRINRLQNTGDLAIANEDRSLMRLVSARALMQSNFVEGLSQAAPDVCSKRGCVGEVKSFVAGVWRSAQNYVVGNQGAAQDWDNTWSAPPPIVSDAGQPLGGLGITQGPPDPTPPPNKPTTLRSVSPDYKPRQGGAPWDGTYSGSANVSCDTASSDFADSFADSAFGNFEVRGGKVIGGAVEITIDSSGHASYNTSIAGFTVTSDYYFVQTQGGGVSVSGNFSMYGGEEGVSISCNGDFEGSRIGL